MSDRSVRVLAVGLGACALAAAAAALSWRGAPAAVLAAAGGEQRGTWSVERVPEKAAAVHLTMGRRSGRSHWNSSDTVALATLEGLSAADLAAPSAEVRFARKHDAGTFTFT